GGEVPRTHGMTLSGALRMLSGLPFTLVDTSSDPDRNGQLFDPLPGGTYSGTGANAITVDNKGGRNGAFGPGYLQLDSRIGWRFKPHAGRTVDVTADVINVTNRANFVNPTADRRSTNFLLLTTLYGGGPRRFGSQQVTVGLNRGRSFHRPGTCAALRDGKPSADVGERLRTADGTRLPIVNLVAVETQASDAQLHGFSVAEPALGLAL